MNEEPNAGEPLNGPLEQEVTPTVTWGWGRALLGLAVAFAPVLLLNVVALLVGGSEDTSSQATTGVAVSTVVMTLVLDGWYLLAAWLFSLRDNSAGFKAWGFRKPTRSIFWAVPAALVAVYAVSIVYNMLVKTEEQDIMQSFPREATGAILFLLLACVIAPFFEETFFRGFLFQGFSNSWGVVVGAIASAGVFALSHQQLDIFLPLFALGLALAWVYHVTRSVWGAIALHAVYNAVAVFAWLAGG